MKGVSSGGKARMIGGKASACAPACCEPCPSFYKALPCNNPGTCSPITCDVYVCSDIVCAQPGDVFQYSGWCYKVQPGEIQPDMIPPGSAVLYPGDFGPLGPAYCLPTGSTCDHPACQCPPGPWLYFQACPCPDGAGDGVCRVIRFSDYSVVAGQIKSACVVAHFGSGGCQFVNQNSPRASTLPPGCLVVGVGDIIGQAVASCCECCDGCASTTVSNDECAFVHSINPGFYCLPSTCCCQVTRFQWSLSAFFQSSNPAFGEVTVTASGDTTVDLVANPFGVSVPCVLHVVDSVGGTYDVNDSIFLVCGAHNVVPPGIGNLYYGAYRPVHPGQEIDPTGWPALVQQTGIYGCANYRSNYRRDMFVTTPGYRDEIIKLDWTITATPVGGSSQTCSKGCSGNTIAPAGNPCQKFADAGDGEPVGTGAFI